MDRGPKRVGEREGGDVARRRVGHRAAHRVRERGEPPDRAWHPTSPRDRGSRRVRRRARPARCATPHRKRRRRGARWRARPGARALGRWRDSPRCSCRTWIGRSCRCSTRACCCSPAAAALFTGLLTGLAPAVHALRADVNSSLKAGEREGGGQRARLRPGSCSSRRRRCPWCCSSAPRCSCAACTTWRRSNLGWDPDRLLHVRTRVRGHEPQDRRSDGRCMQRAVERARAMPGVAKCLHDCSAFRSGARGRRTCSSPGMDSVGPPAHVRDESRGRRLFRDNGHAPAARPRGELVRIRRTGRRSR